MNKGVPSQDARELASAIIHVVYQNCEPSPSQKILIDRYFQYISSAEILSLQFL